MKKAWIKLKHWLIKKLGGHVSPPIAPKIEYHIERPVELYAELEVDDRLLKQDKPGVENVIKQRLAKQITESLLERDLIDIVVTDDPMWFLKTYKARVRVYSTKGDRQ